ncbi:hypothetical protein RLW55_16830 [Hyphomicrobium sp. B1]|uniref:HNH endonuclease n=1 Tax=Hyphomicrobium sp. B1 TaxID=3075651 RepID=UPI003C2ACED5
MKKRPLDTPLDPATYEEIKAIQLQLKKWSEGKGVRAIAARIKKLPFYFGQLLNGARIAIKFTTRLDENGEHEYVILSPSSARKLEAAGWDAPVWQRKRDRNSDDDYVRIKAPYPDGGKNSPTPHTARVIYELEHNVVVPRGFHVTVINGNPLDLRIENLEMRENTPRGRSKKK